MWYDFLLQMKQGTRLLKDVTELASTLTVQLPPGVTLDDSVTVYGAVMSQQGKLVRVGDYISVYGDEEQVCGVHPQ